MTGQMISGGETLVRALLVHGADLAFCVPGESYLPVLDAFHHVTDKFRLITCRNETGATNMAEAHGKLMGRPGLVFVTRGPGACHASIGVHTAFRDSTPMILFVGQVSREMRGREAFQEIDFRAMFAPIAKWVVEVEEATELPGIVAEAWHKAMSGRKGPVVVSLPEDILSDPVEASEAAPIPPLQAEPSGDDIAGFKSIMEEAERPLVILGGSGWSEHSVHAIRKFVEQNNLPAGAAFRFQDLLDNRHPNYVGDIGIGINPELAKMVREADVILALGPRLGEMTTSGYTLLKPPKSDQRLIHVHAGSEELGRVYQAELAIHSSPGLFAEAISDLSLRQKDGWQSWLRAARENYQAWNTPQSNPGDVQIAEIYAWMRDHLDDDAILTNGAGNYTGWLHRYYHYRTFKSQLAPTSGAMGYGVPAAIAAKIACPDRQVISISGDGCFLMTGQELATAVQYDAQVVFLVFNNSMLGTIRMHQERHYPGRISGTDLVNPDFASLARSFGVNGATVEKTSEFAPAMKEALACGKPALIEVKISPEAISTQNTMSEIRGAG